MNRKVGSFKDFVVDQLRDLEEIEARRMFGGYVLYRDETFFGIVHKGKLFFKVNEFTLADYRKHKMNPFRPTDKQTLKSYYQVPVEIIEDADALCDWALRAVRCQEQNHHARRP